MDKQQKTLKGGCLPQESDFQVSPRSKPESQNHHQGENKTTNEPEIPLPLSL